MNKIEKLTWQDIQDCDPELISPEEVDDVSGSGLRWKIFVALVKWVFKPETAYSN